MNKVLNVLKVLECADSLYSQGGTMPTSDKVEKADM